MILLLPLFTLQAQPKKILFFGDSITAGYGVGQSKAFPALIQQRIDSLEWDYKTVNGGLSGETTAGGLRRVDWMLQQDFEVFVLELGGNDGLRGIDLKSTRKNLQGIIDKVRKNKPGAHIMLAGMRVPPNLGVEYTRDFHEIYSELARENDISLIPFLLEGVGGNEQFMQNDGIHPNAAGHRKVAEIVWDKLKPILQKKNQ